MRELCRPVSEELKVRGIVIDNQKHALEHTLLNLERLEKALADADCEVVRLANAYQTALRRLNHKFKILRWPAVRLSYNRMMDRVNGKYNGV